jgi:hypothetical protein
MTEAGADLRSSLRPAYAATRAHLGIVVALVALAALGWWWTADEIIKAQDRHLREAARDDVEHRPAHDEMKGRWRHPVRAMGWYRDVKKAFAALP